MLNLWLLSVVTLYLCPSRACCAYPAGQRYLTTDMPFWRIRCLAGDVYITEKGSANPAVSNVQPQLLQFFGHSGAAVALQAQAMLLPDMGQ